MSSILVNFANGQILTASGLDYVYIYCANTFGISKETHKHRIEWVEANLNAIISMDKELILRAKSPIQFAGLCLVIQGYHADPDKLVRMPIYLDATCSGLQHIAGLMGDYTLGEVVNLVPSPRVRDIYSELLGKINQEINEEGKREEEEGAESALKYVLLTREQVKKPIMTKVYNSSVVGMKDQLITTMVKRTINNEIRYETGGINGKILLTYKEVFKTASIIYKLIFSEYPSIQTVYTYFLEIVRLMVKIGVPISWRPPSGLKIIQKYNLSSEHKFSITIGGRKQTIVLRWKLEKVDTKKQGNAVIPNIIHSLDASHLHLVVGLLDNYNISDFLSVHDCFGTHPNNTKDMSELVRLSFANLYSSPHYIDVFHQEVIKNISDYYEIIDGTILFKGKKIKIPAKPSRGELDLSKALDCIYMIN